MTNFYPRPRKDDEAIALLPLYPLYDMETNLMDNNKSKTTDFIH